jgi:hypothetical protein
MQEENIHRAIIVVQVGKTGVKAVHGLCGILLTALCADILDQHDAKC